MNVIIVDNSDCVRGIIRSLLTSLRTANIAEAANASQAATLLDSFPVELAIVGEHAAQAYDAAALFDALDVTPRHAGLIIVSPTRASTPGVDSSAVTLTTPFTRTDLIEAIQAALPAKRAA